MGDEFQDFYQLLDVRFEATYNEIKSAYRKRVKLYHPDVNPDDAEGSAARFRLIREAFEVLSDVERRRHYDREWRKVRDIHETPEPPGPAVQVSDKDWEFACRYYPDLAKQSDRLKRFSEIDEKRWRNHIFFEKAFDRAADYARAAEEAFLGRLVGGSEILRTLASDALLAGHEPILSELANALRVLGARATENIIGELCTLMIELKGPQDYSSYNYETMEDDDRPLREEQYRDHEIRLYHSLTCGVDGGPRRFRYVFEARKAIDAFVDMQIPLFPLTPTSSPRRRRS